MRHLILLIIALLLFSRCKKETPASNTPNSNTFDAEKAALNMFEQFNKHNWQAMANCYADTAFFLDPSISEKFVTQTRMQTIFKYQGLQASIPDVHDSIVNIFASGEKVLVEFVSTGTLPGNNRLYLPICTVLTFKDGLIIKDATYYDN